MTDYEASHQPADRSDRLTVASTESQRKGQPLEEVLNPRHGNPAQGKYTRMLDGPYTTGQND